MKFGSFCSGISAASVAAKTCTRYGHEKPLDAFHKQPRGKFGRTSACKPCAIAAQKECRERKPLAPHKRAWNLSTRYGITEADEQRIHAEQRGLCGICAQPLRRHVIDHDHATGKVRALLCHECNLALGHVERKGFIEAAIAYLAKHKGST